MSIPQTNPPKPLKTADNKTPIRGMRVWWGRTLGEYRIAEAFGSLIAVPLPGGSPEEIREMFTTFAAAQAEYERLYHPRRRNGGRK